MTPLHKAALKCRTRAVKMLLKLGSSVNKRCEPDGETALHLAAMAVGKSDESISSCLDTVSELVKAGVPLDITSSTTLWTPMHYAARRGSAEMVKLLIELGASKGMKAMDGTTAQFWAQRNGHTTVVSIIDSTKADPLAGILREYQLAHKLPDAREWIARRGGGGISSIALQAGQLHELVSEISPRATSDAELALTSALTKVL